MQPWPLGKNYDGRATAVVIRCDDANVDLTDAIPRLQDLNFPPDNFLAGSAFPSSANTGFNWDFNWD
jgi:hypothetical protein